MARGFLSGVLAGGFVSVLGLGTASMLSEQPAGNTPPAPPQVDAPQAASGDTPASEAPSVSGPGEGEGPSLGPAPDVESAAQLDGGDRAAPDADTAPPAVPRASSVEGDLGAPSVETGAAPDVAGDAPVLPNPQAPAPDTPDPESDIVLSTDPGTPPAPVVVEDGETQVGGADGAPIEVEIVEPDDDGMAGDPVEEVTGPVAGDDPQLAGAGTRITPDASPQFEMQGGNTLLQDRETGVAVNRPGQSDAAENEPEAAPAVPALVAYAADAPNPENLPVLSIILIDAGGMAGDAGPALVAGLPFPVTVAIDPGADGAAERLAAYRSQGTEAAILARLPEGATPQDVEVALEGTFASLTETVAVLDLGGPGLSNNREATRQLMRILSDGGRGFVSVGRGLNMADRVAEQEGVPTATVYRDLDAEGQDASVIRRFVDQAAFRARQQSGVVLIGRVRPDTITALMNWGNDKRAAQVAQVPLSAVLQAQ
ncbi:divergent polysaccharide deacetylase family protein [Salibaculum griseiflavum]|uniref:divergent polysaccharide deacetylase family protein n=1 Tax=Salibaculum griseiflavum TaxID=1914409 RepID=UPI001C3823AC|nr:divergent polysaccharide deacetylase family protein [Salibaculum griseiflavum]